MIRSKNWKYKIKMDTGRLWDDHLGQLGYQPKFYRVQDANFTNSLNYGSFFFTHFSKKHKIRVFRKKSPPKKKKAPPGSWDASSERVSKNTPIFCKKGLKLQK